MSESSEYSSESKSSPGRNSEVFGNFPVEREDPQPSYGVPVEREDPQPSYGVQLLEAAAPFIFYPNGPDSKETGRDSFSERGEAHQSPQNIPPLNLPGVVDASKSTQPPLGDNSPPGENPQFASLPPVIKDAFDTGRFRTVGHQLIDRIAEHYDRCQHREKGYLGFPTVAKREDGLTVAASHGSHDQDTTNLRSYNRVLELMRKNGKNEGEKGDPAGKLGELFDLVLNTTVHLHHPHNMAHQLGAAYPAAVLAEFLACSLSNSQAVSELATVNGAIERICVEFAMKKAFGWDPHHQNTGERFSDGIMTVGGSLANLTALVGLREKWKRAEAKKTESNADGSPSNATRGEGKKGIVLGKKPGGRSGAAVKPTPVVFVSSQAHYCVDRACKMMGLESRQIVKVDCDPTSFSINMESLRRVMRLYPGVLPDESESDDGGITSSTSANSSLKGDYEDATALEYLRSKLLEYPGERFSCVAVVCSAGSTSTGQYDDIEGIGAFIKPLNINLHVDGAHGGAVCFLKEENTYTRGIRRYADSIAICAHKLCGVSNNSSFCLMRDGTDLRSIFQQDAAYLINRKDGKPGSAAVSGKMDLGDGEVVDATTRECFSYWEQDQVKNTVECTKPQLALRFFALLFIYGDDFFDQHIRHLFSIGQRFSTMISDSENFPYEKRGFVLCGKPAGGFVPASDESGSGKSCLSNIVCFRLKKYPSDRMNNELNLEVRARVLNRGNFYLSQTTLNGKVYLRCTFMVPYTNDATLTDLLDEISEIGKDVERSGSIGCGGECSPFKRMSGECSPFKRLGSPSKWVQKESVYSVLDCVNEKCDEITGVSCPEPVCVGLKSVGNLAARICGGSD